MPRVLGDLGDPARGPLLVVLGGVHGNEPAGVAAISRVVAALSADPSSLRGRFLGLSGNRGALAVSHRYLERDLNRAFLPARLVQLAGAGPSAALGPEDRESLELSQCIAEAQEACSGPTFLLDIHSTSSGGAAFSILDDTLANRAFGFAMPVPHVLGLEEEIAGTITSWANARGVICAAFESGQHVDPVSVARAEAALWIALESSGVIAAGARREPAGGRRFLRAESVGLPSVVEVRYRHALPQGHAFRMEPGYRNFHPVKAGELLATDGDTPVSLDQDALLLMPLYQPQGDDGFFVVQQVNPAWLNLSAWLRRLRLHHLLTLLPGVERHAEQRHSLRVDRHKARWLALEIFHLLGYRREFQDEHGFVMTRRERN